MTEALVRQAREAAAGWQDSVPSRYGRGVQMLAFASFAYIVLAYLNERVFHLLTSPSGEPPFWFSHWTEYAFIVAFGIWRTLAERNTYTRKRLAFLTGAVGIFWWIIPDYLRLPEPYIGSLPGQPILPQLHAPGTLSFFAVLLLVLLFGRRIICGWNCPCVGVRETVGFAFRDRTPRSDTAWRWRHLKWVYFALYAGVTAFILIPAMPSVSVFYRGFLGLVTLPYFATMLLSPWIGNRSYCRFLCPYGATFGLLNRIGFFQVAMDRDRCIDCGRCEQVCDMGIPVWRQGKTHGRVVSSEECMGCGRCVVSCPSDALAFRDVRDVLFRGTGKNASQLLGQSPAPSQPRVALPMRPAEERRRDWAEDTAGLDLPTAVAQAQRCLDCGVPACRTACPLGNRIPDWLAALGTGDVETAARLCHETNSMPDICGRLCPQDRLCEGACARGRLDGAVAIGQIEAFICEEAARRGWSPTDLAPSRVAQSVAVIGAGPAGLSCADVLARSGVSVEVYDRRTEIGGLLTGGVPSFKLAKDRVAWRREMLERAGVTFTLGVEVDAATMAVLLGKHDFIFLATGAQRPRMLGIPGEGLRGVVDGLSYLAGLRSSPSAERLNGKTVVVLGGGDTAFDCARTAVRQGAAPVTVAYRGTRERLRTSPKEVAAAIGEDVTFQFEHVPSAFRGVGGLESVVFADRSELRCDLAIVAIGQLAALPAWLSMFGVAIAPSGFIITDPQGRTSNPRIFAGGDNAHGPDLVVTAAAAGRRAGHSILAACLSSVPAEECPAYEGSFHIERSALRHRAAL